MPFAVAILPFLYSALSAFFISVIGTSGRASAMAKILVLSGHLRASSLRVIMSFIVSYTFVSIAPAVELNHHTPVPATAVFPSCHTRASRVRRPLIVKRASSLVGNRTRSTPLCRRPVPDAVASGVPVFPGCQFLRRSRATITFPV